MEIKTAFVFLFCLLGSELSAAKPSIGSEQIRSFLDAFLRKRNQDETPTGNSCWLECGQGGICPSKRQTGVNTNIALGKSVCASAIKSTKGTLNSITDGENGKSFWVEPDTSGLWVVVDLEGEFIINDVTILNLNLNTKSSVEIRVGNEKEAGKNEACGCGPTITSKASKLVVKCSGLKGRYVFVIGDPGSSMGLSELQVFPREELDASLSVPAGNIAWKKPACLSSVKNKQTSAELAVDGNLMTNAVSRSSDETWLRVDLRRSFKIGEVKVFDSTGRATRDLSNPFEIRVGDSTDLKATKRCGCDQMSVGQMLVLTCAGVSGRFVFLLLPKQPKAMRQLNIRELQVFEFQSSDMVYSEAPEILGYDLSYGCSILRYNDAVYNDVSENQCAEKCKSFAFYGRAPGQGCLSFEYDRKGRTCFLSSRTVQTVPKASLVYRDDFVYYQNSAARGMCSSADKENICEAANNEVCVEKGCCFSNGKCYYSTLDYAAKEKAETCGENCNKWFAAFESGDLKTAADAYYETSSAQFQKMAKFTSTEFVDFIINNKEIKEGLLTFGLPLKFQLIKNMFDFYQVFGGEKMVEYPQLFLGIAYQRRDIGVKTTPILVDTGTSTYKVSYFTKGQLEQMAAMTENQLKLVLEEEATGLKHLIEEEKLLEEKAKTGGSDTTVETSKVESQWERDHENEILQQQWDMQENYYTELCGVEKGADLPFPPRGEGTSGLEAVEYYLSRDEELLKWFPTKTAPWPLLVDLDLKLPLEECYWSTEFAQKIDKISTYTSYGSSPYVAENVCQPSIYAPGSLPWLKQTVGRCGTQSHFGRSNYICNGIPAGRVAQACHYCVYRYTFMEDKQKYELTLSQSLAPLTRSLLQTKWHFPAKGAENRGAFVDYARGLANSMNVGLEQWQQGQVAFNIFQLLPKDLQKSYRARKLLYAALQQNHFMVHIFFHLSNEITYAINERPYPQQLKLKTIDKYPSICPAISDEEEADVAALQVKVRDWIKEPAQTLPNAFNEYWLRMFGNPKCCKTKEGKEKILARLDSEISWLRTFFDFDTERCDRSDTRNLLMIRMACETEFDASNPAQLKEAISNLERLTKENTHCTRKGRKKINADADSFMNLFFHFVNQASLTNNEKLDVSLHACSVVPSITVEPFRWNLTSMYRTCITNTKAQTACDEKCQAKLDQEVANLENELHGRGPDLEYWTKMYENGKCIGICHHIVSGEMVWGPRKNKFFGKFNEIGEDVEDQQDFIDSY